MMLRFFFTWLLCAAIIFIFTYFTPKAERKLSLSWAGKFGVAAIAAGALLAIIMLVNNLSGV